jgi:16S rRNA G966 N2-methylase RsmD
MHYTAADLMLHASKYPEWDMKAIAQQLVGKQIAKKKLPTWFKNDSTLYPIRLSMEQCSSELAAIYKTSILNGGKGIDITGGFGVDTSILAKQSESVVYCERNTDLATIVENNFKAFKQSNIKVFIGDGIECLSAQKELDWIFVDPARRKEGERVFRLPDCEPNVIELKDLFFEKANQVLIKTAPLLDIQRSLKDLEFVKEVHILSVNNDCKEVLYLLEKGYTKETKLVCINLKKENEEKFSFTFLEERNNDVSLSEPLNYLYEPNASVLKAGAFKSVATKLGVLKLHQNSHLYTSEKLVKNFPGRAFKIKGTCSPDKKSLAKNGIVKANLACRNFPQKIAVLKKKLKLKDGGEDYIFATTLIDGKPKLLLCEKEFYLS